MLETWVFQLKSVEHYSDVSSQSVVSVWTWRGLEPSARRVCIQRCLLFGHLGKRFDSWNEPHWTPRVPLGTPQGPFYVTVHHIEQGCLRLVVKVVGSRELGSPNLSGAFIQRLSSQDAAIGTGLQLVLPRSNVVHRDSE